MIQLYHNDMSVCGQKVRIALAELGLEWEDHHLKLRGDEQLRPEYLRINPKGQVPTIVDDGIVVTESTVINEYLADSRDALWLLPATPAMRARMRLWTRQLDEDVHRSTGIVSQAVSFRHQYLANGPEQLAHILRSIPEESRREGKRVAFSTGMDNPGLPMAARRMDKALADMDAQLAQTDWLAGDGYSLADIGMTPYVLRMEHLHMTMMFQDRPHLGSWFARVRARPSYREAIERWLNPDYLSLSARTGAEAEPAIREMLAAA